MRFSPIVLGAGLLGAGLLGSAASAAEGVATGNVNMRTCASTRCAKIITIPAGAPVFVYSCGGWCELDYAGRHGFASANYIAEGRSYAPAPPPVVYQNPDYYDYYDEQPYFFEFDYGHRRPIYRHRRDNGHDHDGHHDHDQGQNNPPHNFPNGPPQDHQPGPPHDFPSGPPNAGSNEPRHLPFYGDAVQQRRLLDSQPQLNGWQRGLSGGSPCPPGMNGNCR